MSNIHLGYTCVSRVGSTIVSTASEYTTAMRIHHSNVKAPANAATVATTVSTTIATDLAMENATTAAMWRGTGSEEFKT